MNHEMITTTVLSVLGMLATLLFPAIAQLVFKGVPALLESIKAKTQSEFLKRFLIQVEVLVVAAEQEFKVRYQQAMDDGKLTKDEAKAIKSAMFVAVKAKALEILSQWPKWVKEAIEPMIDHAIESTVNRISGKK